MEHTIGERNIYFIILAAGMQPKTYNTSHDLYVKLVQFVNLDRKEQLVCRSLGMDFEHAHLTSVHKTYYSSSYKSRYPNTL
jgi:hypothetical protein